MCGVCECGVSPVPRRRGGGVDNIIWSLHGGFVQWDVGIL